MSKILFLGDPHLKITNFEQSKAFLKWSEEMTDLYKQIRKQDHKIRWLFMTPALPKDFKKCLDAALLELNKSIKK